MYAFVYKGVSDAYIRACVCVCVCVYVCVCVCVCVCVDIGELIYCHTKVDGYPCMCAAQFRLADLPWSTISSLLRHSAMYALTAKNL